MQKAGQKKDLRSLAQNRLYWKWLGEIARDARTEDGKQLTADKWHYLCKLRFLGFEEFEVMGMVHRLPAKSTRKLSVKAFTDYLMELEAEFVARHVDLTFNDDYEQAMGK